MKITRDRKFGLLCNPHSSKSSGYRKLLPRCPTQMIYLQDAFTAYQRYIPSDVLEGFAWVQLDLVVTLSIIGWILIAIQNMTTNTKLNLSFKIQYWQQLTKQGSNNKRRCSTFGASKTLLKRRVFQKLPCQRQQLSWLD